MDCRFLLFVVVVAGVQAQCGSAEYTSPKCNSKVVEAIEKYWGKYGKPTEIFEKPGVEWKVYKNTDSGVYGDATCVTYTPLCTGKVAVSIDGTVFNNITISLKDGFLTVSADADLHLVVKATPEMIAVYRCNPNGPPESATLQPDAAVLINPSSNRDHIFTTVGLMKSFGLKMTKSYGCIPSLGD